MASLTGHPGHSVSPASSALQEKALKALRELPPFSPVLNKLLASLAEEDVSFAKLSDLMEKDTVIAGNILHLVNSALYARQGTVNSVRHALSLMGLQKLRNAVLGMSLTRSWAKARPAASWSMARFNMHSAATAILSDMIAQHVRVAYPEGAFVAGLLHDVGHLLIAIALPAEYGGIIELHARGGKTMAECERTVLGFEHPELSAQALRHWNLPEPIQLAVRDHHDLSEAVPGGALLLGGVVGAADTYVKSTGVAIQPAQNHPDTLALEQLGLDRTRIAALLGEFQTEFDAMAPFFR